MNLFAAASAARWLQKPAIPSKKKYLERAVRQLSLKNLDAKEQEAIMQPLIEALSDPIASPKSAMKRFKAALKEMPERPMRSWSDLIFFASVYLFFYQGLFCSILIPFLHHTSMVSFMNPGWRVVCETLLVYLIFKAAAYIFLAWKDWKTRLILTGALLLVYAAALWLCRMIPAQSSLQIPLWLFLLATGLLALSSGGFLAGKYGVFSR